MVVKGKILGSLNYGFIDVIVNFDSGLSGQNIWKIATKEFPINRNQRMPNNILIVEYDEYTKDIIKISPFNQATFDTKINQYFNKK